MDESLVKLLEQEGGVVLGSFSGNDCVLSFEYELADRVFRKFKNETTDDGLKSFLTSLGIPSGFFKERNQVIQENLVEDTKEPAKKKKKAEEFLVYVADGLIQYVAPHNEVFGWESPKTVFNINEDYWDLLDIDFKSGQIKYFCSFDKSTSIADYVPGVFCRIPIFYQKSVIFESGLYCYQTGASIVDRTLVKPDSVKIFPEEECLEWLRGFMSKPVGEKEEDLKKTYLLIMEYFKSVNIPDIDEFLYNIVIQKPCPVPKFLVNKVKRHRKNVMKGKPIPDFSPEIIKTAFDLLHVMSIYSKESDKPITSRVNMDKKAFAYMFKEFNYLESDINAEAPVVVDGDGVLVYNILRD